MTDGYTRFVDTNESSAEAAFSPHPQPSSQERRIREENQFAIVATETGPVSQSAAFSNGIDHEFSLFSMRNPRDVLAGIASGSQSIAKGIAVGAASLFVTPYIYTKREGAAGFFKGVALGATAAVGIPMAGVFVAATQIVRGAANTPSSIINHHKGLKWDKETRRWVDKKYNLSEEIVQILDAPNPFLNSANSSHPPPENSRSSAHFRTVKETGYYELLEVAPNASKRDIQRNYYKLALRCHPDKNPDDPDADEKFKQIGIAYQVLIDDNLRAQYDQFGKGGINENQMINMDLVFSCLFGLEKLEPYFGKMNLQETLDLYDPNSASSRKAYNFEKQRQSVRIAAHLRDYLDPIIDSSEEVYNQWETGAKAFANDVCADPYGDVILEEVSWIYRNVAQLVLSKNGNQLFGGTTAKWKRSFHGYRKKISLAKHSINTYKAFGKIKEPESEAAADDSSASQTGSKKNKFEQAQAMEKMLPSLLMSILSWYLVDTDVVATKGCKKYLKDESVSNIFQLKRARMLLALCDVFDKAIKQHRDTHHGDVVPAHIQFADAFIKAAQKADESENAPVRQ